jgi:hypothetical protein
MHAPRSYARGPRGPSYVNLDASLVKRFKVNDRIAAEFRVDAFNATNTRTGRPDLD